MPRNRLLALSIATGIAVATGPRYAVAQPPGDHTWLQYTSTQNVVTIEPDPARRQVWIGTSGGVVRWSLDTDSHSRFTVADGLSASYVHDIAVNQANGDVWFGTTDGLSRRSAAGEWWAYRDDSFTDEFDIMWANDIHSIVLDPDGSVWLGTGLGVAHLTASGRWRRFSAYPGADDQVVDLGMGPGDSLWGITGRSHAFRLSRDGVGVRLTEADGLASDEADALVVDSEGSVWIVGAGVVTRLPASGGPRIFFVPMRPDDLITARSADAAGGLWLATATLPEAGGESATLLHMDRDGTWTTTRASEAGFGVPWIRAITVDADDVWIGTGGAGAYRQSRGSGWRQVDLLDAFNASWFKDIAVDGLGNRWFAAYGMGSRHTPAGSGVVRLSTTGEWGRHTEAEGLAGGGVHSLAVDSQNNVWVGSDGGASRIASDGQAEQIVPDGGQFDDGVYAVHVDPSDHVWFSSLGGLSERMPDGRWRHLEIGIDLRGRVDVMAFDRAGGRWVAEQADDGNWYVYRVGANGVREDATDTICGLAGEDCAWDQVTDILIDARGQVWVSLLNLGLFRRDTGGTWSHVNLGGRHFINRLAMGPDGELWIATWNGMLQLLPGGEVVNHPAASGPGGQIDAAAFDLAENLWLGHFGGIAVRTTGPGGTCASSLPLMHADAVRGRLDDAEDIHVYTFQIDAPFTRVEISAEDPNDELELRLFRSCLGLGTGTGRHIGPGTGRHIGGEQRLVYDALLQTGTHHLSVSSAAGQTPFPRSYAVRLGLTGVNPGEVRTLILTHEPIVAGLFPDDPRLEDWSAALKTLADHDRVGGHLVRNVQEETDTLVRTAYEAWQQRPADVERANAAAEALRHWIVALRATLPRLRYVVLAGDDRVIPHHRVAISAPADPNWVSESEYLEVSGVGRGTSIWNGFARNLTFSDDPYGASVAVQWNGGELPIPELAVGRLVESPTEMLGPIDAFLSGDGELRLNRALVAGWDFMVDGADAVDAALDQAGLGASSRERLIGSTWGADALRGLLATERYDLTMVAMHATHDELMAPDSNHVSATEVQDARSDVAGTVSLALACHSGLSVPGDSIDHERPIDFAQAWLGRGATFIGSTGWAYGQEETLGYQEALISDVVGQMVRAEGATIGDALIAAKQSYFEDHALNHYHAKTLVGTILYGLPMQRVIVSARSTGRTLVAQESRAPRHETRAELRQANDLLVKRIEYIIPAAALQEVRTSAGSYLIYPDNPPFAEHGRAVQPMLRDTLAQISLDARSFEPHGVVFRAGQYDVAEAAPLIARAGILGAPFDQGPRPSQATAAGWSPAVPAVVNWLPSVATSGSVVLGRHAGRLLLYLGQFAGTGDQRVYKSIEIEAYHSDRTDRHPPAIHEVGTTTTGSTATFEVAATDESGVIAVELACDDGNGTWRPTSLEPAGDDIWRGTVESTVGCLVQAVDAAGNVTADHNSGRYHGPGIPSTHRQSAWLPAVSRP